MVVNCPGGKSDNMIFVALMEASSDGTLVASGHDGAAGIGGNANSAAGHIVIEGGTVTANGGIYAAGIGCGQNGTCGDITITTGITRVTATIKDETITTDQYGEFSTESGYVIGAGFGFESTSGKITLGDTVYDQSYFKEWTVFNYPIGS